jgi:dipeptidase D
VTAVDVLAGLEPAGIWERFSELTRIARPPKEEAAAREHVTRWAEAHGYETAVDDEGNLVVRVPASAGREAAPAVVLQAHLDMVCEREPDSSFDPRAGRILVAVEGDWVVAPETTLGADNGIGVAAAMAAAEDPEVEHGPLELLFTVSEEQGLDGAKALDPALVSGRLLLNLDGTSDSSLTVGCAGSTHVFTRVELAREPVLDGWTMLEVALSGARGGHSGGDIAKGRVNAIKALGRLLAGTPLRLARLEGGVSRNALPREARAVVAVREPSAFGEKAERELAAIREQFSGTDDSLVLSVEPAEREEAANETASARVLDLMAALPSGVVAMSPALPASVETSTSLNVATTEDGVVTLASMTRSANARALDEVVATIDAASRLAGANVELRPSYPPWRPDLDSELLATARATFERLFGAEPALEVVHGGLECAVIGDKLPGVRMISLGPEVVGPHAPGERLSIPGTRRFYRLLTALLDDLSR